MNIPPIPQSYIDQAVRPRGATVNERLEFLLNWYVNTCEKNDTTDTYQRAFLDVMGNFGNVLRPILLKDTDEETRVAITNFIPLINQMRTMTRHAHDAAFLAYLYVEINKVIA